ncbi:cytochrome P450 [Podospora didyma]|uniref:Cytochrome P450 n=1 Tax=Podospora didyma TaxID=330526 RepID=A0AAE0NYR1_9PEZI|nr:cytochrome P450 [Podospora didyma]
MESSSFSVHILNTLRIGPLAWESKSFLGLALALVAISFVGLFAWHAIAWFKSPLRKFPGPFLAGWTNAWRLVLVLRGKYQYELRKLHAKYGPVVRLGPNLLAIDYPELVKVVYGPDGRFLKTEFYHNNSFYENGKLNYQIFSETTPAEHAIKKKPFARCFTPTIVQATEPLMDSTISIFLEQLDNRFANLKGQNSAQEFDLARWLNFYAWDFMTQATFSRRFGYLDHGCDFDGSLQKQVKMAQYFQTVGQMPFLDYLLDKNPIVRIGPPNIAFAINLSASSLFARLEGKDEKFDPKTPDFLQHFIESRAIFPDTVDNAMIMSYLLINILAGADTSAITMTAVFYLCLKNPPVFRRLVAEVRAPACDPDKPYPYSAACHLPYLEAVVRESLRVHPVIGMMLPRYVPEGGLTLPDGSFVPAGTQVGINQYITGCNKSFWGDDVAEFRPERWLPAEDGSENEETYNARRRRMIAADLSFGGGIRVCTGKSLALENIYKLVATLLNRYDVELVDPSKEWTVTGTWFQMLKDVNVKIELRK